MAELGELAGERGDVDAVTAGRLRAVRGEGRGVLGDEGDLHEGLLDAGAKTGVRGVRPVPPCRAPPCAALPCKPRCARGAGTAECTAERAGTRADMERGAGSAGSEKTAKALSAESGGWRVEGNGENDASAHT
ncbi:hypothetical protein GCM10027440_28770 [Nocardiopsis coralliicola]